MNKISGSIEIARISQVPVYLHWSVPLGGILISAYIGFIPLQAFYFCISFLALVLVHEFGHVFAALLQKLNVHGVHITGVGGVCYSEPPKTKKGALFFYSAGLLTQALTFLIAVFYIKFFGGPESGFLYCLFITFTYVNFFIFIANIWPSKASGSMYTDGYHIWSTIRGESNA